MLRTTDRPFFAVTGKLRLLLTASVLVCGGPVSAESLNEALSAAYQYNPALESARSRLRAVDEDVSIANSGYRPRVDANSTLSWEHTIIGGTGGTAVTPTGTLSQGGANRQATYGVTISQPIFTGLQTTNRVRTAEAIVRASREQLRDTEGNILLQAAGAYARVVSSQEAVSIQEKNLTGMEKQVRIAKERVALTELTNTDLSQAELRRASAVTLVATARADLKASRAAFLNIIGHEPNGLHEPKLPGGMPKSLSEAQAIATQENPLIVQSLYSEEAARHSVDRIRGQLLPQVSLLASWGDEYNTNTTPYQSSALVQGRVSMPLYEGGQIHAEVRQAKQVHLSQLQAVEAIRSFVQRAVATSWSQLEATRTRVELGRAQIRTAQIALEGVRREEGIGQRTLLDVLNAEQDLLNAQIAVITARRDLVIASYDLLFQIGRLDVQRLGVANAIYDPTVHYEEVRRKWYGLSITYSDGHSERLAARDGDHVPSK